MVNFPNPLHRLDNPYDPLDTDWSDPYLRASPPSCQPEYLSSKVNARCRVPIRVTDRETDQKHVLSCVRVLPRSVAE
jgi:hypothetical protein